MILRLLLIILWNIIWNLIFFWIITKLEKKFQPEESDLPKNNLVEFVWEDEEWNGIYRIK